MSVCQSHPSQPNMYYFSSFHAYLIFYKIVVSFFFSECSHPRTNIYTLKTIIHKIWLGTCAFRHSITLSFTVIVVTQANKITNCGT